MARSGDFIRALGRNRSNPRPQIGRLSWPPLLFRRLAHRVISLRCGSTVARQSRGRGCRNDAQIGVAFGPVPDSAALPLTKRGRSGLFGLLVPLNRTADGTAVNSIRRMVHPARQVSQEFHGAAASLARARIVFLRRGRHSLALRYPPDGNAADAKRGQGSRTIPLCR